MNTTNLENVLGVYFYYTNDESEEVLWETILDIPPPHRPTLGDPNIPDSNPLTGLVNRLKAAQNVLICREIMSILVYEASCTNNPNLVSIATQDEVIASIFPDLKVKIKIHRRQRPEKIQETPNESTDDIRIFEDFSSLPKILQAKCPNVDVDFCHEKKAKSKFAQGYRKESLSLQLKRLLFEAYRLSKASLSSIPTPSCLPVQIPSHLRSAGAMTCSVEQLSPDENPNEILINTAAVAGYGAAAAAFWSSEQKPPSSHASNTQAEPNTQAGLLRPLPHLVVPPNQSRYGLFTEWTGAGGGVPLSLEETIAYEGGCISEKACQVANYSHSMQQMSAGQNAIQLVLGTPNGLLNRFIQICKHFYLREELNKYLNQFQHNSNLCVSVIWCTYSSAVYSSVKLSLSYFNFSAYKWRIGISVYADHYSIHFSSSLVPRVISCPNLDSVKYILNNELNQVKFDMLEKILLQLLGWSKLISTSGKGPKKTDVNLINKEYHEEPNSTLLLCSPSCRYLALIHLYSKDKAKLYISDTMRERGSHDSHTNKKTQDNFSNQTKKDDEKNILTSLDLMHEEMIAQLEDENFPTNNVVKKGEEENGREVEDGEPKLFRVDDWHFEEVNLETIHDLNIISKIECVLTSLDHTSEY